MSGTVWIGLCLLLGSLILEIFAPQKLMEGFQAATTGFGLPKPTTMGSRGYNNIDIVRIVDNLLSRRSDVTIGVETAGYFQDRRYFSGYADVEGYGKQNDFCRMVTADSEGLTDNYFFACALAGTKGSAVSFKTEMVKDGFKLGRDDYMRDILKDGREAYCRLLKQADKSFQPMCRRALDTGFTRKDELDTNPPEEIMELINFYAGCEIWLRMRDDLVDYIGKAVIQTSGGTDIDQAPRPTITRGLHFNGRDQFVRFGDTGDLSIGNKVPMRSIRGFSVWVYFDEFTNNAHIFDFGDGPGLNNVFLGILGKGDSGGDGNAVREESKCPETTIPDGKSGAQFCPELKPQTLMYETSANVNKWECPAPDTLGRVMEPIQTRPTRKNAMPTMMPKAATLIYEVWDEKLRKVQIKVNGVIPLKKWTHILIAAKTMDAMRPDLNIFINSNLVYTQEQSYLPQTKTTSNNYLGKSNWANDSSGYELRDELFSGSMFDFRMYSGLVSQAKGKQMYAWGSKMLGLS
jgi:hypothetical protein